MNPFNYSFLVLLSFLTFACSTAPLGGGNKEVPFFGFQVHRYQFKNGLKLLVLEDNTSPTFAYQTWYQVGSKDETPGKTGLAHLFEHMMFKETKNLKEGEFDRKLSEAGVKGLNAFTTQDHTVYIQQLPKDQIELVTRLESERMHNLIVNDQAFKTEIEVVKSELDLRIKNNPMGEMFTELFATAFTTHPYRRPIAGYEKDLSRMSAGDALDFYKTFYSPSQAIIVVVGDVKAAEVANLVGKHYESISTIDFMPSSSPGEPRQVSARHKKMELNILSESLLMGYHSPPPYHQDAPAIGLLEALLSYGKSSRLENTIVEAGLGTTVYTNHQSMKDPGLFIFSVQMQKGKKAKLAEKVILKELDHLRRNLVPTEELDRAKNLVRLYLFDSLEKNPSRARMLGESESLFGQFEDMLTFFEKMQKVEPEQIQKVVQRYFQDDQRSVVIGVPKK